MSIKFECPKCKKELEAENDHIGMKLDCPQCNEEVEVPKPSLKATKVEKSSNPPSEKKKEEASPKQIISGCLTVIILAVLIGSCFYSCGKGDAHNDTKAVLPEQIISVNIYDILTAYKNNEVGADNTYKNKYIRVTGYVDSVKKDILGSLYVTLGTGRQFEIPQIQAFFDDSQSGELSKLQKGQELTIVGKVDGLMMNVLMKKCVIKNEQPKTQ